MFQTGSATIDVEDQAFWNVEAVVESNEVASLLEEASSLGAVLREEVTIEAREAQRVSIPQETEAQGTSQMRRRITGYLKEVSIVFDTSKRIHLQAQLIVTMLNGVLKDDGTRAVVGLLDEDFQKYEIHNKTLLKWVQSWMRKKNFVFRDFEAEVALKVLEIARQALGYAALKQDIFEALQDMKDQESEAKAKLVAPQLRVLPKPLKKPTKGKKVIDLMAIPEDDEASSKQAPFSGQASVKEVKQKQKQMAMF